MFLKFENVTGEDSHCERGNDPIVLIFSIGLASPVCLVVGKTISKTLLSVSEIHFHVYGRNIFSGWWFHNMFYFHPYLGKIPNLTNIFQRG